MIGDGGHWTEPVPEGPGASRGPAGGDAVVTLDGLPIGRVDGPHRALTAQRAAQKGVSGPAAGRRDDEPEGDSGKSRAGLAPALAFHHRRHTMVPPSVP